MRPFFSILVVCLNPGDKLKATLESIMMQTFRDYEILVKDGGSADGSLAFAKEGEERLRLLRKEGETEAPYPALKILTRPDTGIYDAMNQAAEAAAGKYLYFLNCGDYLADERVLADVAAAAKERESQSGSRKIWYGNILERKTGQIVPSNPRLDAFGCYRNVPCHQACFYDRELVLAHPFVPGYRVRADYEQFLWCFFQGGAEPLFLGRTICNYEGGGFSETGENRKRSAAEHREIVEKYMTGGQLFQYRLILWITLAPLRTRLAENPGTAQLYNRVKKLLYKEK